MLVIGIVMSAARGESSKILEFMIEGADSAVSLSISLAGSYMLWMGLMRIAERAGLVEKLARLMKKPLRHLLPDAGEAMAPITLNLAANFFGLGNAATPFGLEAMRLLKRDQSIATNDMCMFIALNASAIELLPTTVIAIRTACGSSDPYSVVLPTLAASIVAAVVAVVACKLLSNRERGRNA